jgi:hypothetical protein
MYIEREDVDSYMDSYMDFCGFTRGLMWIDTWINRDSYPII